MAEIIEINSIEEIENFDDNLKVSLSIICEFWDVFCCSIVKNNLPVGVALAPTLYEAKLKAVDCNPIDSIGSTISFSKKIDLQTAKSLSKMGFTKLVTLKLDDEIKNYLSKTDLAIFELGFSLLEYKKSLVQDSDLTPKSFKVATKLKPTQEQIEDMVFSWKILKTIKNDSIIIAKDFKTRAIGVGNTEIEHIEQSMDNACDGSKEAVFAVSKNISDVKKLHPLIQGRISAIIEPVNENGQDTEVIKTAEKYGITVVTTGNKEE